MVVKTVIDRIARIVAPRKKPAEIIDANLGVRAQHSAWTAQQNAPATNGFISAGGRFDVRSWIRR
ncbi:MAG: hypothetical protein ABSF11_12150 [Methylocella sp.]|jgi:hypothetical protein